MQLPQIDDLDAEPPAARMSLLDQIFGTAKRSPEVRSRSREPALGRDMDLAIGRERFSDQLLGKIGAIGIGGVDEIDANVRQPTQRLQNLSAIRRRTPDPFAHDAHRAKAKAV